MVLGVLAEPSLLGWGLLLLLLLVQFRLLPHGLLCAGLFLWGSHDMMVRVSVGTRVPAFQLTAGTTTAALAAVAVAGAAVEVAVAAVAKLHTAPTSWSSLSSSWGGN